MVSGMAQRTVTVYTSDLSGKEMEPEAARTATFSIDGLYYEIDVTHEEYDQICEALAPFMDAGRKLNKNGKAIKRTTIPPKRHDLDDVREWARKHGLRVSDRGRVAQNVLDEYDKAHGG